MNVIITNIYREQLKQLQIQSQVYMGIYDVNDIGNGFQNQLYDNLIIDVTAINNYQDVNVIKQLTNYINPNNVIILLENSCINDIYLNGLVTAGIYNFTNEINDLIPLMSNHNTFHDVAGYQNTSNNNDRFLINNSNRKCKVVGFVNVTEHAGATTLVYTLVKYLKKKYNVIGIEVDASDFSFYNSKQLISTISNKIHYLVDKNSDCDLIFIDTNGSNKALEICDDIIYLVEPTTIKINKLLLAKPNVFEKLFDRKIVLNRSTLSKWEIAEFENEARIKVFYSLPNINERNKKELTIVKFLNKLGFKI